MNSDSVLRIRRLISSICARSNVCIFISCGKSSDCFAIRIPVSSVVVFINTFTVAVVGDSARTSPTSEKRMSPMSVCRKYCVRSRLSPVVFVIVSVFTVGFAVKVNGRLAAPFLTVVMLSVISVGSLNRYFPTFSCLFA